MIIIYYKWLLNWEYTLFSDKPIYGDSVIDSTGFKEFIRSSWCLNIENLGISLRILRCQSTKLSGDRVSLMWVNHGKPCCRVSANGLFLLATNAGISHDIHIGIFYTKQKCRFSTYTTGSDLSNKHSQALYTFCDFQQ